MAQISPGALSRGHEALDGVASCTSCHERGAEIGSSKCLSCHGEIAFLLGKNHGMHARVANRACNECHKEHLGRDASITRFSPSSFDHKSTGFELSGKHAGLDCAKCHEQPSLRVERSAVPKMATRKTFLGLRSDCSSCHRDRHDKTAGADCRQCHTTSGWAPIRGFDHSRTKFVLTGKHESVLCAKCHESFSVTPRPAALVFTVDAFADCAPCHRSPHKPEFSRNRLCRDCHATEGWRATKGFDHTATKFPLVGRHIPVACEKCHAGMKNRKEGTPADFTTRPFDDCRSCHTSPHPASLNQSSCSTCHTPASWQSVRNTAFDHGLTGFPLKGKHASTACNDCHQSEKAKSLAVRYRSRQQCATCHEDYHQGIFGTRYKDCAQCHNEDGFRPSTFGSSDHALLRFSLSGAHGAVVCRECHAKKNGGTVFSFASLQCVTCHEDIHKGAFHKIMGTDGCVTCHTPVAWNRILFDHQRTEFPLLGKHLAVACGECHKQSGGRTTYLGTTQECASCHKDPHMKQFAQNGAGRCESCHTPRSWRMLIFDHESQSSFRLTGAHSKVPCGACHKSEKTPQGSFVRFKPLVQTCEGCHKGSR